MVDEISWTEPLDSERDPRLRTGHGGRLRDSPLDEWLVEKRWADVQSLSIALKKRALGAPAYIRHTELARIFPDGAPSPEFIEAGCR